MGKSHRDNYRARKKIGLVAFEKKRRRRAAASKPRCRVCGTRSRPHKIEAGMYSICCKRLMTVNSGDKAMTIELSDIDNWKIDKMWSDEEGEWSSMRLEGHLLLFLHHQETGELKRVVTPDGVGWNTFAEAIISYLETAPHENDFKDDVTEDDRTRFELGEAPTLSKSKSRSDQ